MKQSVLNKLKLKWKLARISNKLKNENNYVLDEISDNENLWLRENYSREQTELYLSNKDIGVFLIRKSESIENCYVLSVKVPKYLNKTQISHYLIEKTKLRNYRLRGSTTNFKNLTKLIIHCSTERDLLPIILNLCYYQQQKDHVAIHEQTKNFNEFLYYSSGSSIASSNFSSDVRSSTSTLPDIVL